MRPLRLPLLLACAVVWAPACLPAEVPTGLLRLLAASDPFSDAPEQVRLGLVFTGANGKRVPLEIWRRGDDLSLVRLLGEKDRGKFVLRRGAETWLLTPGARNPVRMSAALAPAGGAALDQLLALRIGRDYRAVRAVEETGTVRYELEAKDPAIAPARVVWVLDRARRLPLRIEFRSADDRVERLVEFKSWKDERGLVPERLVAKDVLRGGAPLDVEILAVEERAIPEQIFDLDDGSARAALPPPLVEPGGQ